MLVPNPKVLLTMYLPTLLTVLVTAVAVLGKKDDDNTMISREGYEYTRHLFKPIPNSMTGGAHADVFLPKLKGRCKNKNQHDDRGNGNGNGHGKGRGRECDKIPVAITYHGGGFTICDSQHIFLNHVGYLLEQGFAVVGLEYRMAPQ